MAVGGIDNEHVDLSSDERRRPLQGVGTDSDGRANPQPAALVLGRKRVPLALLDVLHGDEPTEMSCLVNDR